MKTMDFIMKRFRMVSGGYRHGTGTTGNIFLRPSGRMTAPHLLRLPILCLMAACALSACKKDPQTSEEPTPTPALLAETITVAIPEIVYADGSGAQQFSWPAGTSVRVYEANETAGLINLRVFNLESGQNTAEGTFTLDPASQDGLVPGKEYIAVWMYSWNHCVMAGKDGAAVLRGSYMQNWQTGSTQVSSGDLTHIAADAMLVSDRVAIGTDRPRFDLRCTASVLEFDISTDAPVSGYTIDNLTVKASDNCFVTGYIIDGRGGDRYDADSPIDNRLDIIFGTPQVLGQQTVQALLMAVWNGVLDSPVEAEVLITVNAAAAISKDFTLSPMEPGKVYRFDYTLTGEPGLPDLDPIVWDGSSTRPDYLDEQGKTIYIVRPSDLIWLMDNHDEFSGFAGYTVTQTADFDLDNREWNPVDGTAFQGTYDGGGHTIANLHVNSSHTYSGLFRKLSSAVVRDIHIVSGNLSSTELYLGAICGSASNSSIEGCSNAAAINGANSIGGICGYMNSGAAIRCLNAAAVTGSANVGGIGGLIIDAEISYCVNRGAIESDSRAGGIFGDNSTGRATIIGCRNTGNVSGDLDYGMVGGIGGITNSGTIVSCYSTGMVTSTKRYFGGICGYTYSGTMSDNFWLILPYGAANGYNDNASTGCTAFSGGGWPDGDAAKGWGVVDEAHPGGSGGYAWKSMGGWNAGNDGLDSEFPLLWWE